jgi:hypothetical protein
VELAKKALEISSFPDNWIAVDISPFLVETGILDTLAAAYAEVGKFEGAIATQEKVIELLRKEGKPKNLIDQSIERLKSYKANKPWREK